MCCPAGEIKDLSCRTVVLSTAYFPPVEYFRAMARAENVLLEKCESFVKQTYRSRCRILAAGGVENLTLPVVHGDSRLITDVSVERTSPWVRQHEGALVSAYRNSPFFIYYQDDVFNCMESAEPSLFGFNLKIIRMMSELLGLRTEIRCTEEYIPVYGEGYADYRDAIHPKRQSPSELTAGREYYQVFSSKFGYVPSLSALDLLFNEGPGSVSYLL